MDKTKRHCDPDCEKHRFFIQNQINTRLNTQAQFCPKYHREPRLPQPTFPIFNFDGKYYTSAFVLGVDKRTLEASSSVQLAEHTKHVKELLLQKHPKIVFPRPNKKHTFCAVCRQTYTNYYAHIMSEQHKTRINCNQFNKHILQLQDMYKHLHVTQPQVQMEIFNLEEKVDVKVAEDEKGKEGGEMGKEAEQQQFVKTAKITQIIHKEIIEFIISSDQSQESSKSSLPKKRYNHRKKLKSSSSEDSSSESSSDSSESSSAESENELKKLQHINLDSESKSVEIIVPAKTAKKENKKETKNEEKKEKKAKKETKQKETKKKAEKKEKTKEKTSQKQKVKASIALDEQLNKNASKKKKKQKQPKKPQENKRAQVKKKVETFQTKRPTQTLIIKSKTNDPMEEKCMQNILNKIVSTINPVKPVKQLIEINLIQEPVNLSLVQSNASNQLKTKMGYDSPFAPATLKKVREGQNMKVISVIPKAPTLTPNFINTNPGNNKKQGQSKPETKVLMNQRSNNFNPKLNNPQIQKNIIQINPIQNPISKNAQNQSNQKNVKNVTFKEQKQIIVHTPIQSYAKRNINTTEMKRYEFAASLKRVAPFKMPEDIKKSMIAPNHQLANTLNDVIDIDDDPSIEAQVQVQVSKKFQKKKKTQLQFIKKYEEKIYFSQQFNSKEVKSNHLCAVTAKQNQPVNIQQLRSLQKNELVTLETKINLKQDLLGSIQLQTHKLSPIRLPKLSSLISTSDKDEKMEMASLFFKDGCSVSGC